MKALSARQQRIIDFIRDFISAEGYPPSIRDILSGCGMSSTSVVVYNLDVLSRAGYIRRQPEVSRGIELTGPGGWGRRVQVPVIGRISAGEPVAVPTADTWDIVASSDTVEVTEDIIGGKEGVYALQVKGRSMIDALVDDGDIVLMQQVVVVENGEMAVVWLRAEREATLKRFYAEPGRVRLQPANEQMQPIYAAPDNVEIQGRVIAIIRRLT